MKTNHNPRITLALAKSVDRASIYSARHDVYATELGQYESRPDGMLRAGYLCGPSRLIAELRPLIPPWAVSLAAQIAAVYALQQKDYYTMRYEQTHALRKQLVNDLVQLGISEIVPGIANFVMFHLPSDGPDTAVVVSACRTHGLFLRDISQMGSAMGRYAIRIAVKDAVTNGRMIAILQNILSKKSRCL